MSCIVSREPQVAPEPRNRFDGSSYELARIYVPESVAEYILGKQTELRECRSFEVYQDLKAQGRLAVTWDESNRLQYLTELFWVMVGDTSIRVSRVDTKECIPTDYLERENSAFGYGKVQPCVGVSIRVPLTRRQYRCVRQMEFVVEQMKSFKTDFYFHDMKWLSCAIGHSKALWAVGASHTFMEVQDIDYDSMRYLLKGNEQWRDELLDRDTTAIGAVLDNSISYEDDLYVVDGVLRKVEREEFVRIHCDYVELLRERIRESIKAI